MQRIITAKSHQSRRIFYLDSAVRGHRKYVCTGLYHAVDTGQQKQPVTVVSIESAPQDVSTH